MSQQKMLILGSMFAFAINGTSAFAQASDVDAETKSIESNYIINPKGCMGLGDTPETDGLVLVLTYNERGRVTPDGKVVVPKDSGFVVVTCASKANLEKCQSQRATFKIDSAQGPFGLPTSREFSCTKN